MSQEKAKSFHHFLQLNILAGVAIFALMTYFIVTGEYATLAERKQTEGLLNALAIGGLVYGAIIWMLDYFAYPVVSKR